MKRKNDRYKAMLVGKCTREHCETKYHTSTEFSEDEMDLLHKFLKLPKDDIINGVNDVLMKARKRQIIKNNEQEQLRKAS